MAADAVVLEIALLEVPGEQQEAELWEEADEQCLPLPTRRNLAILGLRCGLLGTQLPDWIRHQLEVQQQSVVWEEKDGTAVVSDVPTQRRMQCRAGRKQWIVVRKARQELTLNLHGDPTPQPEVYRDAECAIGVHAVPQGDGSVHLELVSELRHGQPQQCWVGDQGMFRVESRRDCVRFEDSQIEALLAPGQTLLLAATAEPQGVGEAFFTSQSAEGPRRQAVLIRLAQTQSDDRFAPSQASPPIVTPPP